MDKRKTLVLFDVGAVLLTMNFRRLYEGAAALSGAITPEEFKSRYVESRIDILACKGLISRSESVERLRKLIGPREPKQRVHEAGYTVGILSNITELALEQISRRFPEIFETFDGRSPRLYSCRLGAMKPELEIYRRVSGYRKVIFIDDKDVYLEVPVRLLGWKGIWLTPWIDESESLRAAHGECARDVSGVNYRSRSGNFRRADSLLELMGHLRDFGVELA
jgi:hypothetical protein